MSPLELLFLVLGVAFGVACSLFIAEELFRDLHVESPRGAK